MPSIEVSAVSIRNEWPLATMRCHSYAAKTVINTTRLAKNSGRENRTRIAAPASTIPNKGRVIQSMFQRMAR